MTRLRASVLLASTLMLAACARQAQSGVEAGAPGFLQGIWHGFIFPVAWFCSLFSSNVAIYAVPNNGGWYDFGYFIGIMFFGVGAKRSRTVIVQRSFTFGRGPRRSAERDPGGVVIDQ